MQEATPQPNRWAECSHGFYHWGAICTVGQLLYNLFEKVEPSRLETTAVTRAFAMIALGAIATGLGFATGLLSGAVWAPPFPSRVFQYRCICCHGV